MAARSLIAYVSLAHPGKRAVPRPFSPYAECRVTVRATWTLSVFLLVKRTWNCGPQGASYLASVSSLTRGTLTVLQHDFKRANIGAVTGPASAADTAQQSG